MRCTLRCFMIQTDFIMSKTFIRIKIPRGKPDALIALAEKVVDQYSIDGDKGALENIDMETFKVVMDKAKEARSIALKLHATAEAKMQEAVSLLGIDKGQTKRNVGTLYHLLTMIRDQLLVTFFNQEEKLGEYGFKTVISSSVPRRPQE